MCVELKCRLEGQQERLSPLGCRWAFVPCHPLCGICINFASSQVHHGRHHSDGIDAYTTWSSHCRFPLGNPFWHTLRCYRAGVASASIRWTPSMDRLNHGQIAKERLQYRVMVAILIYASNGHKRLLGTWMKE